LKAKKLKGDAMARKRIGMKKIRDVIRLKSTTEMSERQIARALAISRPMVGKYWSGFLSSGLEADRVKEMADSELLRLIEEPRVEKSSKYLELLQYFPSYLIELKRKGVTLHLLWQEYKERHPDGLQYSQFCYHFQTWRNGSEVRMHIKHQAGEKMFVDYAGAKLAYFDRKSGQEKPVEVFVAVLGASGLTYVEASESQQEEDWIRSNERAFGYFGGSTQAIVPDNIRVAVSHSHRYEPEINPNYYEFAEHYGTVIIPARVREARDKALVENAVGLAYQRIYAPMRNRVFYSLQELNEAIWELLEAHNNRFFQRIKISRRELFERTERKALKPLPPTKYPMKRIKWVTVQFNYHVELREDLHYYSVPYFLYRKNPGRKVKMVHDERIVAIYYDNLRIAQHIRDRTPNGYTTVEEHMPAHHRLYSQWSSDRFLRWAGSIGGDVREVIVRVLKGRKHPEQAFKVCMGILNLAKKYDRERLNRICRQAIRFQTCSLKRIESMLKLSEEEEKQPQLEPLTVVGEHENIRGSRYYH
jgi:transposase